MWINIIKWLFYIQPGAGGQNKWKGRVNKDTWTSQFQLISYALNLLKTTNQHTLLSCSFKTLTSDPHIDPKRTPYLIICTHTPALPLCGMFTALDIGSLEALMENQYGG